MTASRASNTISKKFRTCISSLESWRRELERTDRELDKAIQAILDGVPEARLKDKIGTLEARKAELAELLADAQEPSPLLHPNMADIYRQKIATLDRDLQSEEIKAQAAETFRSLVSRVDLVPEEGTLAIFLRGDLAAILRFVAGKKNPDFLSEVGVLDDLLSQASVVAGMCNHLNLRFFPDIYAFAKQIAPAFYSGLFRSPA